MNTRDHMPKSPPVDLPDEVKEELLRRRDAVEAGEPTIEANKGLDEVKRRLHSPNPA